MNNRNTGNSRLSTALAFLKNLCTADPGTRLAPVTELASRAGVGIGTMWRAVRTLAAAGILEAHPRRGIFVRFSGAGTSVDDAGAPPVLRPAWRRIAAQIRTRIEQGDFDTLPDLPIPKVLSGLTGANYRTVRKALEHLAGEGLVRPSGRTYTIVHRNMQNAPRRIVLVSIGARLDEITLPIFRSRYHFFLLESLCASVPIGLEIIVISSENPVEGLDLLNVYCTHRDWQKQTAGFIIWTAGFPPQIFSRAMALFAATDKPVGILDEREPPVDLTPFLSSGRQRCFVMGHSERDAAVMGEYVLRKEHKKVLFVGYERLHWTQKRIAGIRSVFADAGRIDDLRIVLIPESPESGLLADGLKELAGRMKSVLAGAGKQEGMLLAARQLGTRIDQTIDAVGRSYSLRNLLAGLVSSWSADREINMLVAANDELALACMDLFSDMNISVPEKIAVAGFDDVFEASERNLTSYNFNGRAVFSALVTHILTYHSRMTRQPFRGIERAEGFVVPRRSC